MRVAIFIIVLLVCAYCVPKALNYQSVVVTGIHDGDTFYSNSEAYRLNGIDCPELDQSFGMRAKYVTVSKIYYRTVNIKIHGVDKHSRQLVDVYVDGIWLNKYLVDEGLAWVYQRFDTGVLYKAMLKAQIKRKGIWAQTYAESPYEFRKHKELFAK